MTYKDFLWKAIEPALNKLAPLHIVLAVRASYQQKVSEKEAESIVGGIKDGNIQA